GLTEDRQGAARRAGRRIDRPHVRTQQASARLRLVHGGDALLTERFDHVGGGAADISDDCRLHFLLSLEATEFYGGNGLTGETKKRRRTEFLIVLVTKDTKSCGCSIVGVQSTPTATM